MSPIRSQMGWSAADRVVIRGHDLVEFLLGRVGVADITFLELNGRLPEPSERVVLDAMIVALVEHGITPSTLAGRLTYLGAPESLQGAVAAGVLGLGERFVGTIEGSARMLQEALANDTEEVVADLARAIVTDFHERGAPLPGLGHPVHSPVDPRAQKLLALAGEQEVSGRHCELMIAVHAEAERVHGRELPINATGAIGAIASDIALDWRIVRGLGIIARTIGLLGHVAEEMRQPIARDVWGYVEDQVRQAGTHGGRPRRSSAQASD